MNIAIEGLELDEIKDNKETNGMPLVNRDLSLVGHVPVRVEAIVGDLEMTIDELFALKDGQVLTLQQGLDTPIVLQVNGKSVAQAELVAAGDNFGVRITALIKQ